VALLLARLAWAVLKLEQPELELELEACLAAPAPRSAVLVQAAPHKAPRVDQRWLET
jgi:hypothetical protein